MGYNFVSFYQCSIFQFSVPYVDIPNKFSCVIVPNDIWLNFYLILKNYKKFLVMWKVLNFNFKFIYLFFFVEISLWSDVVFIFPKSTSAWKDKNASTRFFIISNIIKCWCRLSCHDKQNCIIIGSNSSGWSFYILLLFFPGGMSHWSAPAIIEVSSSPEFSESLRDDSQSSCWSSITLTFNSLFVILKLWIVSFKRSDEDFEIGAFNLAGVHNIIDCLLEILLALEIQELSNDWQMLHFCSFLTRTWQRSGWK